MGKRKSAKPQKYVQQPSEDEDEDMVDGYAADGLPDKPEDPPLLEKNSRSLWTKEKPPEDFKKENSRPVQKESVESAFWASHFPIRPDGITTTNNSNFDYYKQDSLPHSTMGLALHDNSSRVLNSSPLETLLSEHRLFNSNNSEARSGTESESEHQRRGKRRRKYVTYPATFRLEVVEHAERFGKSSSAKKYNICVEKVSMWCKTKDNIVHKVKKGGQEGSFDGTPDDERQDNHSKAVHQELEMLYNNDDSDDMSEKASEKSEISSRQAEVVYPVHFKHRVAKMAEEKGDAEAAREFQVCEKRVAIWRGAREWLSDQASLRPAEDWEVELYVRLKQLLEAGRVTVRELIVRAEQAQLATPDGTTISTAWLTDWCHKFRVCFRSVMESTPQPLTENTCLVLETTLFQADREEQLQQQKKPPSQLPQVQDLILHSRTLDASTPSASDREDSSVASSPFLFSSKRRRRSYTLAFKLEVVKFAQSNTKHATSRKYGIARRVISRWIADKESLQTDLMNATQHALADPTTEEVELKLLHYYKELRKKGVRVSKGMLVERANRLFGDESGMSATNGWYKHWVVKWKERGEQMDIAEEEEVAPLVIAEPDESAPLDLHKPSPTEQGGVGVGSSMDALKQAYMTNAILSSIRPTDRDLHIMRQFPELLHLIQANPAILGAAAAQLQSSNDIYRNQPQSVVNLSTTHNNNGEAVFDAKKSQSSVKKRRERYSPDFKLMVIEYASSHSYQETSRKFGVHHITVSEWCKDKERIHKKVYCDNLQSLHSKILRSETAEHKFLAWIQECNRARVVVRPQDVQGKASEILDQIGEAEVKKNCWWFYLWNKRGMVEAEDSEDTLEKESRVNYPPAVKVEIARVAERQSVNCAARCFRVARKRIREWVKSKDKLRWLAETGQVRERGGSSVGGGRKVNCLDVDKEVYAWYETQTTPPRLPEIRSKALQIFQKHGFGNMKCSKEWYRSWCKRYGVCRSLPRDNQLIRWILTRYDKNLPISHQELVEFAASERMKATVEEEEVSPEEEVYAFCRRYPRLLEALPSVGETFPVEMEAEVNKFRVSLRELQEENGFPSSAIGSVDEVPFLFTATAHERRVIVNSGMASWNAVAVLSCLADGTLLPPLVVVKGKKTEGDVLNLVKGSEKEVNHVKQKQTEELVFQEDRLVVDIKGRKTEGDVLNLVKGTEKEVNHVKRTEEDVLNLVKGTEKEGREAEVNHVKRNQKEELKHVVFQEDRLVVDGEVMRRWAEEVWLPCVPSPSLLLLDCFQPHAASSLQERLLEAGVTPVLLPEGCASKLQPLNASVTRKFQQLVREEWAGEIGNGFGATTVVGSSSEASAVAIGDSKAGESNKSNAAGDCKAAAADSCGVSSTGNNVSSTNANNGCRAIASCLLRAFERLRDCGEEVRRSFVVTGVAVAPDGSEDAMIENAEWFGGSGDEHVLSPASDSDSDPDA